MRTSRWVAPVFAVVLIAALTGCGGSGSENAALLVPFTKYDVYLSGIDPAGGGGSELYGLSLNPVQTRRLTEGSTALSPSASGEQIVVEGGEGSNRLGLLQPDGTVGEIPGLGRPAGDSPQVLSDGRIRWEDGKGAADERRFVEWSPATTKTRVLAQVRSKRGVQFASGPGEGYVQAVETKSGAYQLTAVTGKKTWAHKLASQPLALIAGRDWIAAWVDNEETITKSDHLLVLMDPSHGVVKELKGMQPIAWSPGGRRLLAAAEGAAGKPVTLREIWFTPGGVANRDIGEIPAMQVDGGTWRTGIPAPMCKECPNQPTLEKDY